MKIFFVGFLKATDEKSRIRMRIRNPVVLSVDTAPYQNIAGTERASWTNLMKLVH